MDLCYADGFVFVEIKAEHIALVLMVIVQIIGKLLLAALVVFIAMLDFQLDDELLTEIVHDDIRAPCVPCLRFKVVVSGAVDDGF